MNKRTFSLRHHSRLFQSQRYLAGALLAILVFESCAPLTKAGSPASNPARPIVTHTPPPQRSPPNYAARLRYARLAPKRPGHESPLHAARPIDLVRLGRLQRRPSSHRAGRALAASITGMRPWWTYEARSLPGVGQAMVNAANLNFLLEENDVDIAAGGIDLAFRRMYNSTSDHNAANGDASTPSVFGNRWTNNIDAHLAWSPVDSQSGTVSVYTGDGSRDDYSCQINVVQVCTPETAGIHELLAPTQLGPGGVACQFQWTRKSGTSYIFAAPYAGCDFGQGSYGRLLAIYGRNANFSIQLAYSWAPDDSSPQHLTQIIVTHKPEGAQMVLAFGQIAGTTITELKSLTQPDGQRLDYFYDENAISWS